MTKSQKRTFALTMTVVCLLLGFMTTVQISTLSVKKSKGSASDYLHLMTQISQQQKTNELLSQQISKAKAQVAQYQATGSNWKSKRQALLKDAKQVKAAAGLTSQSGAGITITLQSNPGLSNFSQDHPTFDPQFVLSYIVNLLYSQGANAISISGYNGNTQRLVTTSAIRDIVQTQNGGYNTVDVNYSPMIAPFTITAIGNTSRMKAILVAENVVQLLKTSYAESCVIDSSKHLTVPAYHGEMPGKYAKEVTGQ
ncbi:DUF881 domain-containing protein [Alicyclobacillus sp. SO9]|uniref:DUF881 domain-containing protein n=1 Tax=Alicyclobacillus sp. SO9 TaxID=2665646 RepID=UPI0018E706D5|nr:DUF881 domain-containing protein [Alicyclobacillus sp. SO9]QQE80709.1 DUF881 domain-containing protein [Alicyclobacillus sp. SO9]